MPQRQRPKLLAYAILPFGVAFATRHHPALFAVFVLVSSLVVGVINHRRYRLFLAEEAERRELMREVRTRLERSLS